MANLPDAERTAISFELQQYLSDRLEELALSKPELKAAVDAADGWVESNKTSYNNALPAAAKAGLTAGQKSNLLKFVLTKRFNKGE